MSAKLVDIIRFSSKICQTCQLRFIPVRYNSNRASLGRVNRNYYAKTYPTVVVLPNGASINIRYKEPRRIIQLPIVLDELTEEEKELRLYKRKTKKKIVIEDEAKEDFDVNDYKHLWKK